MTHVIPVSVGKKHKEYMDQIIVCATGNNRSISSEICKAVKFYIENFESSKLIAGEDRWNHFIENADQDELLEMNTLICELNDKIMKKWKSQR